MGRAKTQYICQTCGYSSAKWQGQCSGCGGWNSLVEEAVNPKSASKPESLPEVYSLSDLQTRVSTDGKTHSRLNTGIEELNRVLGGGLVPDSFVLLGGDPGIGKSTLLLQMLGGLTKQEKEQSVLYISGEESVEQIRDRANRLKVHQSGTIKLAAATVLEQALALVEQEKPSVLVMDSLQTFVSDDLQSPPGSVGQVREVTCRLMNLAKQSGIAVWLVGHVTKEGNLAGPKVVEHMVDTVLYFEGDGDQSYRILRAVKNRFGSERELGVFEMTSDGLSEISNPSSLFMSDRKDTVAGTSIAASIEGSRPILIELQALVTPTVLALPRRTSVGMDTNRVSLLSAIMEKHMEINLSQKDLYFNVAGGLKLSEPACDLAAVASIWSSCTERALPNWVFIGEVGLTGEVRRVNQPEFRIEEAKKLGIETVVLPESTYKKCKSISGIKLVPVSTVSELSGRVS